MRDKLLAVRAFFRSPLGLSAVAGVTVFLWAYANTLVALTERWANSPQYAHGFLVPGFALAVLFFRRQKLAVAQLRPSGWGLGLLLAGAALRLGGAFFYYPWLGELSLLPSLAGLCLLLGGWAALRWAWPAVAFLLFMLPLPYLVEGAMAQPLQRLATRASTYALQTFGLPAVAEGNVVLVNETPLNVAEACNGLGMLVLFFAISTAVAFVVHRPLWERLLLVASAVPIALAANVARITVTAVLHETVGHEFAQVVFHDYAGWLMMPLALGLLGAELGLTRFLLGPVPADRPERAAARGPAAPPAAGPTRKDRRKKRRPAPVNSVVHPRR
jgi:exosortase